MNTNSSIPHTPNNILPSLVVLTMSDFLSMELPERDYLLHPVIPAQGIVIMFAPRGIGKTFAALSVALAVAGGISVYNWRASRPNNVLYVDGEMPAITMQERLKALACGMAAPEHAMQNLALLTPDMQPRPMPDLATVTGQKALEPFLIGVKLLILDNISTLCRTGKENESQSWQPIFHYAPSRSGDVARELLGDFKGFLQTDGYVGYTALGKENGITHVGCLVHVRRKFIEVNKGNSKNKPGLATTMLNYIANIYKYEKQFRQQGLTGAEILVMRTEKIKPMLAVMFKLMDDAQAKIPPKTLLGIAVKYALGQWDRIENYLLNAQITSDNNVAENAIRPFTIGRKNWLFSGSPRGAESSAVLYSLIETAKANKINP